MTRGFHRPTAVISSTRLVLATLMALAAGGRSEAALDVVRDDETGLELRWLPEADEPPRVHRISLPPGVSAALVEVVDEGSGESLLASGAISVLGEGWFRRQRFCQLAFAPSQVPPGAALRVRLSLLSTPAAGPAAGGARDENSALNAPGTRLVNGDLEFGRPPSDHEPSQAVGGDGSVPPAPMQDAEADLELRAIAEGMFLNRRTAGARLEKSEALRTWSSQIGLGSGQGTLRRELALGRAQSDPGSRGDRLARGSGLPGRADGLESGRVKLLVDRRGLDPQGIFEADRDGIYRIRFEDLQAAGIDLAAVDPAELRLTTRGLPPFTASVEVPLRVVDAGVVGVFDAGDFVELWGPALTDEDDWSTTAWQGGDNGDVNAFFLDALAGPRLRIAERDATPNPGSPLAQDFLQTLRAEADNWLLANHRLGEYGVEHFYWCPSMLSPGAGPASRERLVDIPLPGLVAGSARTAALRARLLARVAASMEFDHESSVEIDGVAVSSISAVAPDVIDHDIVGLSASLLSDPCPVRVFLPGTASQERSELDWIEVDYPRRFEVREGQLSFWHAGGYRVRVLGLPSDDVTVMDVTDPASPVLLTGVTRGGGVVELEVETEGRYAVGSWPSGPPPVAVRSISWAPDSGLRDPGTQADLLVIGPRRLVDPSPPELDAYVAHREAQGLATLVVSMEAVVDEFVDGLPDPRAVAFLLQHALGAWAKAPRYCLLLGDASLDVKNLLGGQVLLPTDCADATSGAACPDSWETAWVQDVPTRIVDNPYDEIFLGHYASDSVQAMVAGADYVPDVALGRLPARTPEALAAVLAKIIAYEDLAASAPAWALRAIVVADCAEPDRPLESVFETAQEDVVAELVEPWYPVQRYYRGDCAAPADVGAALLADWGGSPGAAVLSYVGHGNAFNWTNDALVTNRGLVAPCRNDTDVLGGPPAPVLLNVGCISGAFMNPNDTALLEELVLLPQGGAIAAFGPTGVTDGSQAPGIVRPFYAGIHGPEGRGLRLGDVVLSVQAAVEAGPDKQPVLNNALLGDPALRFIVPFGPPALGLWALPGDGRVVLRWDSVAGAETYAIYRSETGLDGPWQQVASAISGTNHEDSPVQNGTLYHYAVEAVSPEGWPGRWSPRVEARPCTITPPEPPSGLRVTELLPGRLMLTWTVSPSQDLKWHVLRVRAGDQAGPLLRQDVYPTGFAILQGLTQCQAVHLEIRAVNWCGIESDDAVTGSHRMSPCPLVLDPPATVRDLKLVREGADIRLAWSAVGSTVQGLPLTPPVGYVLHRATVPEFLASAATELLRQAATSHVDPGVVGNGEDLQVYLVAAEAAGERGALGHDLPQGVGGLSVVDVGGGMVQVSWNPVLLDVEGSRTAILHHDVYASPTPLDRLLVEGMTPETTVPGTSAVVRGLGNYVVVPVDVHGNRSAW